MRSSTLAGWTKKRSTDAREAAANRRRPAGDRAIRVAREADRPIHELRDSVARSGGMTNTASAAQARFHRFHPSGSVRAMAQETLKIRTRYPPRVFGSPSFPSNGAEGRAPEGICHQP